MVHVSRPYKNFHNLTTSSQEVYNQVMISSLGYRIGARARLPLIQCFSTSSLNFKPRSDNPEAIKRQMKREQNRRLLNKQPPETHPLYMEVPMALKYIRASEIGNPAWRTTISIHMTVLPEKGSKPLLGEIYLPKPITDTNVIVFSSNQEKVDEAKKLGAVYAGGLDLIDQISKGLKLDNITHAFATPDIVKDLKSIAKAIGPKGLMPSIKKGSVDEDIASLMKKSVGALPFKQHRDQLAIPIARCDFSDKEVIANLKAASDAIYACQPPGTKKPNLLGQTAISSTSGPAIIINFKSF